MAAVDPAIAQPNPDGHREGSDPVREIEADQGVGATWLVQCSISRGQTPLEKSMQIKDLAPHQWCGAASEGVL